MQKIGTAALAAAMMMCVAGAQAGDAQMGRGVLEKKGCWQCHGYEGQGGVAGPRLANTELPEEGFISFVHNSNGAMPPYSEKIISDKELSDVYAYLQARPKPADPKTIPLLSD